MNPESLIQLAPGSATSEPRRVKSADAPDAVKQFEELRRATEAEFAEKQVAVEAARQEALAVQSQYDDLVSNRNGLLLNIQKAERELSTCQAQMEIMEGYVEGNWQDKPLHDHMNEFFRREFLATRLPRYIGAWKKQLAATEKELAAFRKQHGIGE